MTWFTWIAKHSAWHMYDTVLVQTDAEFKGKWVEDKKMLLFCINLGNRSIWVFHGFIVVFGYKVEHMKMRKLPMGVSGGLTSYRRRLRAKSTGEPVFLLSD
jgi:hypothetical protein